LRINLLYHYSDLPPHFDLVFRITQFAIANQSFPPREKFDESPEASNPGYLAGENVPYHQFSGQTFNLAAGPLHHGLVWGTNSDSAVILNVDTGAGFLDDGPDDSTAGPDESADLLNWYFQPQHLRGVWADFLARLVDGLAHLFQDVQPSNPGLFQSLAQNLFVKALDLDVHLKSVDALGSTCHLKVHIA
jgi:hypothetical protein